MSQVTVKEYHQIVRTLIPAVAPLLINYQKHLKVIRAVIEFMMLASYTSPNKSIIDFLQKSLIHFDKL
jgi:hypothetical protein